jgi:hypothetical protein
VPDHLAIARSPAQPAESLDAFDVPAAVLCAVCGRAECEGCLAEGDRGSGVVAIVPWERADAGAWSRLWATSRHATFAADGFFAALPNGPLGPALRFALFAELLAVASMATALAALLGLALPELALAIVLRAPTAGALAGWAVAGLLGVTLWMVVLHAAHGVTVDVAARRAGAGTQRRRALRLGLYSCGWDLMTSPLGAAATLFADGARATLGLASLAVGVPGRATLASLRGIYGLEPAAADAARALAIRLVSVVVLASVLPLLALMWLI